MAGWTHGLALVELPRGFTAAGPAHAQDWRHRSRPSMFVSRIEVCLLQNLCLVAPRARAVRLPVGAVVGLVGEAKAVRRAGPRALGIRALATADDLRWMARNAG